MSNDTIKEGDVVTVWLNAEEALVEAEVLYIPCATGDAWRLRCKSGDLIYVQQYAMIVRKDK